MKSILFILIYTLFSSCALAQQGNNSVIDTSKYFEFHNNYWVNLHHFLYQKAKNSQLNRLQAKGKTFLDIGENSVYLDLDSAQLQNIEQAVKYYERDIIAKDLLFELGNLRVWFQEQNINEAIIDTTYSEEFTNVLNKASKVYRTAFWPLHSSHNKSTLDKSVETIKALEVNIIPKLEKSAHNQWPPYAKTRVDLTVYANWAGAYTASRPLNNIVLSTIAPYSQTPTFIETIFHEGSHLLFNYTGPFRSMILAKSKEMNINHPKHLWHASLFYLSGRLCQDEFKKVGINDYQFIIDKSNIFSDYYNKEFKSILEKYYNDQLTLENTVELLLLNLK